MGHEMAKRNWETFTTDLQKLRGNINSCPIAIEMNILISVFCFGLIETEMTIM